MVVKPHLRSSRADGIQMPVAVDTRGIGLRFRVAVAVVATVLVLAGNWTPDAAAESDEEAEFVEALNSIRADLGLPELEWHEELASLGRDHAALMAEAGTIFHADPISEGFEGEWQKLGENVGVGAGVDVLVDAFVASPGHYANIVDPAFTHIGVGVVWEGAALYTTHRFLQPPTSTTPRSDPVPTATSAVDDPAPAATTNGAGVSVERVTALVAIVESTG